jgi:hypothetical protein
VDSADHEGNVMIDTISRGFRHGRLYLQWSLALRAAAWPFLSVVLDIIPT